MDLPPLTYLTVDEVTRGVGASQVLPYLERLSARGLAITLHSFEQREPELAVRERVTASGIDWRPHVFGRHGAAGGLGRVARGARAVRHDALVHARSDLPAAAALLGRPKAWVWDVRALWADQRIALGLLRQGSPAERVLRKVESAAASRSSAITTLTQAAIDVLAQRHGEQVRSKATVISTCVDLGRFSVEPLPPAEPVRLLLSGSFNQLYDLDLTRRFITTLKELAPVELTLLRDAPSSWDAAVAAMGGTIRSAAFQDMPAEVQASHAGLSICRMDIGTALAGTAPTKIGEFLACGRPVVVSKGIGDLDDLINQGRCGVVLHDTSDASIRLAVTGLLGLLTDGETPARCRAAAEQAFALEDGVSRLIDIYRRSQPRGSSRVGDTG
ncbi:MAG: hypothetical protein ABIV94_06585 [Acidimicrobiales bacterium]